MHTYIQTYLYICVPVCLYLYTNNYMYSILCSMQVVYSWSSGYVTFKTNKLMNYEYLCSSFYPTLSCCTSTPPPTRYNDVFWHIINKHGSCMYIQFEYIIILLCYTQEFNATVQVCIRNYLQLAEASAYNIIMECVMYIM